MRKKKDESFFSHRVLRDLRERIQEMFALAGGAARAKGILLSNPACGGIGTKSLSLRDLCDLCERCFEFCAPCDPVVKKLFWV